MYQDTGTTKPHGITAQNTEAVIVFRYVQILSLSREKENSFSVLENEVLRKALKPAEKIRSLENYTSRNF
jgi:hypothetical protein